MSFVEVGTRKIFGWRPVLLAAVAGISIVGVWLSAQSTVDVCPAIFPSPLACQLETRILVAVLATIGIAAVFLIGSTVLVTAKGPAVQVWTMWVAVILTCVVGAVGIAVLFSSRSL
jgi:hypothetical protein